MYSEEFVKYLFKYQSNDFKEKKEEKRNFLNMESFAKKKYATIPINTK